MKAQDKPGYVAEARQLLEALDVEKLVNNPNDLGTISKINRLIAIFTNFSSNDGQDLKKLLLEFQKWARRSTSIGTIRNRAVDMIQFVGQKIEEMDIYTIEDEPGQREKREKITKELKDEKLYVRQVLEGKDMHLFISEQGKQEHSHLIFDAITGVIRIDPKDQEPFELIEKVVSVTTKDGKQIEATMRGLETSLQFKESKPTTTNPPILYLSSSRPSGGSSGHFTYFTIKNISKEIAIDIVWGVRGFAYEWRTQSNPFELEPGKEKEVEFKISDEKIFNLFVPELNFIIEYKDAMSNPYFARRELKQEQVPSGTFFELKPGAFHPPVLLVDDGLKLTSGPTTVGDRVEAEFSINTPEGQRNSKIGISRTFLSVWGFLIDESIKNALLELGHRKIRKMAKEGNVGDYVFITSNFPPEFQNGFEGYTKLRDLI